MHPLQTVFHNTSFLGTAADWRRFYKEVAPSATIPGQYNHPLDAAIWLQHFKTENGELVKSLKVRVGLLGRFRGKEGDDGKAEMKGKERLCVLGYFRTENGGLVKSGEF